MDRIRTAVIGAGHLGRFHAAKYAALAQAQLTAVVDVDADRAQAVAGEFGARACRDYREILGTVDAVSVAVPASDHFPVVRDCLDAGLDVLVEKPIAVTIGEAEGLIARAEAGRRILQVGHLERFNPVTMATAAAVAEPLFIECHRLAPFTPRGTDVDVLLDLMIHDIDLALALVGRDLVAVEAHGAPVLSDSIDIANARLRFDGGCVANVTASRISVRTERKMRFFQRDAYISADFQNRKVSLYRRERAADGSRRIVPEQLQLDGDALRSEIEAFLDCVGARRAPLVGGREGRRALAAALMVREALQGPPA